MRRALSHRDFRLLWISQALSTLGDRVVLVILALYVNDIGTPSDVGIVLAAGGIPFVVLLLLGGVWADRLARHRVMVVTDIARGLLHALLAVLIITSDVVPIWAIAVIEALFGAAHAFFRPAYTGLLPQTVPDDLIQEAQAVTWLTYNVSGFFGPALASALFLTVGAGVAFAIDAATFFAGAALLALIRPRERGGPRLEPEPILRELAGGWRELRGRPWALLTIGNACLLLLLAIGPFQALGPAIAEDAYDEAAIYGVIGAIAGVGSIFGSTLAARWRPRRPLMISGLLECAAMAGHMAFAAGMPLIGLAPFILVGGAAIGLWLVWWETALATEIPPSALSRVSSIDWMVSLGLLPVGLILAGPLGEAFGLRETLFAGSALALAIQLAVALSPPIRRFQSKTGLSDSVVEASA